GFELAARIRSEPALAGTALLLMSSDGVSRRLREGADQDFDASLSKPLRQAELYEALVDALERTSGIPRAAEGHGGRERPYETAAAKARVSLRVLLAEDHPVNQKVATRILEGAGHRVTLVGDGGQALDALAAAGFDVVLMDVQMPVMDGFEAVASIRTL